MLDNLHHNRTRVVRDAHRIDLPALVARDARFAHIEDFAPDDGRTHLDVDAGQRHGLPLRHAAVKLPRRFGEDHRVERIALAHLDHARFGRVAHGDLVVLLALGALLADLALCLMGLQFAVVVAFPVDLQNARKPHADVARKFFADEPGEHAVRAARLQERIAAVL